jgi:hypothetical protein
MASTLDYSVGFTRGEVEEILAAQKAELKRTLVAWSEFISRQRLHRFSHRGEERDVRDACDVAEHALRGVDDGRSHYPTSALASVIAAKT